MKKKMIYITIILSVFISTTSLKAQAGLGAEDGSRSPPRAPQTHLGQILEPFGAHLGAQIGS